MSALGHSATSARRSRTSALGVVPEVCREPITKGAKSTLWAPSQRPTKTHDAPPTGLNTSELFIGIGILQSLRPDRLMFGQRVGSGTFLRPLADIFFGPASLSKNMSSLSEPSEGASKSFVLECISSRVVSVLPLASKFSIVSLSPKRGRAAQACGFGRRDTATLSKHSKEGLPFIWRPNGPRHRKRLREPRPLSTAIAKPLGRSSHVR